MAIVHPCHQCAELQLAGLSGKKGKRGVALEHRHLGWTDHADLKVVVHDGERVEAELIGCLGDAGQVLAEAGRPVRVREVADGDSKPHVATLQSILIQYHYYFR